MLKRCTKHEPAGEFPRLTSTLNYFKVSGIKCSLKCIIRNAELEYRFILQTAFDQEEAKKEGCIIPKPGVDAEYDAVLDELSEIKYDLNEYLEQQRKHFGVKVNYFGSEKKRFQIEVPDSQLSKVTTKYELQSQRKGFKRYYTAETKVYTLIRFIYS